MDVLVCVKQIPDPNAPGKLDPQTKRLVREGVDLVLDPGDEHAAEAGAPPFGKKLGGGKGDLVGSATANGGIRPPPPLGAPSRDPGAGPWPPEFSAPGPASRL